MFYMNSGICLFRRWRNCCPMWTQPSESQDAHRPDQGALAGHQPSPAAPPHTERRSLGEATSFYSSILMKNGTDPHFNVDRGYFVSWYPSRPHASPPLFTPTVSRCCFGSAQGSPNPPMPAQVLDRCLKHLKLRSGLLFWQLDLILGYWAVLATWGALQGSALVQLNLLTFVPTAPACPWPYSSCHSAPHSPPIPGLQINPALHSSQHYRHFNSSGWLQYEAS